MTPAAMWTEACRRAGVDPAHIPDDLRTIAWAKARGDDVVVGRRYGRESVGRIVTELTPLIAEHRRTP